MRCRLRVITGAKGQTIKNPIVQAATLENYAGEVLVRLDKGGYMKMKVIGFVIEGDHFIIDGIEEYIFGHYCWRRWEIYPHPSEPGAVRA